MYMRTYGGGVGRDWPAVFGTERREEVEAHCRSEGLTFGWLPDGRLRTSCVRPAIVRHPRTGELSWFNQAQHWHTSCLDPVTRASLMTTFPAHTLPRDCRFGDGTPIADDTMGHVLAAYRRLEVVPPWRPGDILLVDNVLTAHARNPYAGERRLLVAMGELTGFDAC
jgi:hypothetical protein